LAGRTANIEQTPAILQKKPSNFREINPQADLLSENFVKKPLHFTIINLQCRLPNGSAWLNGPKSARESLFLFNSLIFSFTTRYL
jgi:hypothetical protein